MSKYYNLPAWDKIKDFNRIIVAGSRTFNNYNCLNDKLNYFLKNLHPNVLIISGTARGADSLGEKFAKLNSYNLIKMPALWNIFGKYAGHMRNIEMAKYATHAVLFWDYKSRGTYDMIEICKTMSIPHKIIDIRGMIIPHKIVNMGGL